MNFQNLSAGESRLWRRFQQYLDAGQLIAAQATLESLIQRLPQEPLFRIELGKLMLQREQPQAATAQWLRVANDCLPTDPWLIFQLAQHLFHVGEVTAVRGCLDQLQQQGGLPASLWAEQAQLRSMLGEIPAAKAAVEKALAAGSDAPDDFYLHATVAQFSGDVSTAAKILDECVRRWPFFGGAVMARSNLRRQSEDANHLAFLRRQLQRFPTDRATPSDNLVRAEFESAAFKELDDLGRHGEAWAALQTSNALMHELNPYDASLETAVTDALISHSPRHGDVTAGAPPSFAGPMPIFIVGMPRSGTTLLDRMLSNHSKVTSAGEINDFMRQLHWLADVPPGQMLKAIRRSPQIDFTELGARYLQQTQWRARGSAHYIDKLPANIQMVAFIRRALPHAPILHMVRDPMEVCFSNYRAMFGDASAYSYDFKALAHYYGEYVRLAGHWRSSLPEAVLDVSYRELVSAPEASLRRVLGHCGLMLEEACLRPERNVAPVTTPSNIQVREAIHTRSLGQWRNYEEPLRPLQKMIAELAHLPPDAALQ
ncbi:tetratricopeptide (TPR) repeat protein [Rhodanobacter sp. TND4EL1]